MTENKDIKDLIPIEDRNGQKAVSAQLLYSFLGYNKTQWKRWYVKNIENNDFAIEGVDYQTFDIMSNGNPTKDFALALGFAKELCMLARNEKGKQARLYFIKCEEIANGKSGMMSELLILQKSVNALVEHESRISKVESRLDALDKEREENTRDLLALPMSGERVPEMSLRAKVRRLVNEYSYVVNIHQQDVWHKIYEQLFYLYKISIRAYKKQKGETNIDVAERNGFLDKMYTIISNMIREHQSLNNRK